MHGDGNGMYGLLTDCLQNAKLLTIFEDFVVEDKDKDKDLRSKDNRARTC